MNVNVQGSLPVTETPSFISHLIKKSLEKIFSFYLTKLSKLRVSEKWYVANELVHNVPKRTTKTNIKYHREEIKESLHDLQITDRIQGERN